MRFSLVAGLLLCGASSPLQAGVFTDDLSRCMVSRTTEANKVELARWMFAAMSKNPSLSDMAKLTEEQRDGLNKATAELFTKLLTVDCRSQTIAALKNEGTQALGEAGQVLGTAAAHQLLASPEADAELSKMAAFGDKTALQAVLEEAGVKADDK